jgi:hypothetical protein
MFFIRRQVGNGILTHILQKNAQGMLDNPKQVQNHQNNRDYDQRMDPTAGLRDPLTDISAKKAEQP